MKIILILVSMFISLSTATCPRCSNNPATDWKLAIPIAAARAKLPVEKEAMIGLIQREHGWDASTSRRTRKNKVSSAYGLGQFIDGTWSGVGIKKTDCTVCQIEGIYYYCRDRREYGSVANAVKKWESRRKTIIVRGRRVRTGGWY